MRPFIILAAVAVGISGLTAATLPKEHSAAHGSRWNLIYCERESGQ